MRVWVYEKKGWPCVAYEDERDVYEGRPLVAVFDTLADALPMVETMIQKARAAKRADCGSCCHRPNDPGSQPVRGVMLAIGGDGRLRDVAQRRDRQILAVPGLPKARPDPK